MTGLERREQKLDVKQLLKGKKEVNIGFRVNFKLYEELFKIAREAEIPVSELMRKAVKVIIELRDDYLAYFPPRCPECLGVLTQKLYSSHLACMKCRKEFKLEEGEK